MDEQLMLDQLEALAQGLEIEVRFETMHKEARFNPGGLCRIKGVPVVIINKKAPVGRKVQVLGAALKRFDLSGVYLRPGLREFLESIGPGETVEEDDVDWSEDS